MPKELFIKSGVLKRNNEALKVLATSKTGKIWRVIAQDCNNNIVRLLPERFKNQEEAVAIAKEYADFIFQN